MIASVAAHDAVFDRLAELRYLPVVRARAPLPSLVAVAGSLLEGGLPVVEYAMTDALAAPAIAAVRERWGDRCLVGAGTVRNLEQARQALAAGAHFIVAPDFNAEVMGAAHEAGVGYLPGVFTASEVGAALDRGLCWLKLFPAGPLGPGYLRALLGPYPQARFMVSGGVSIAEAPRFLEAGARFVGMTAALVPPELDEAGAWRETLRARLRELTD